MTLDEILKEINNAETIVISAHESPDGDAGRWLGVRHLGHTRHQYPLHRLDAVPLAWQGKSYLP